MVINSILNLQLLFSRLTLFWSMHQNRQSLSRLMVSTSFSHVHATYLRHSSSSGDWNCIQVHTSTVPLDIRNSQFHNQGSDYRNPQWNHYLWKQYGESRFPFRYVPRKHFKVVWDTSIMWLSFEISQSKGSLAICGSQVRTLHSLTLGSLLSL